jgi:hypothetical protein
MGGDGGWTRPTRHCRECAGDGGGRCRDGMAGGSQPQGGSERRGGWKDVAPVGVAGPGDAHDTLDGLAFEWARGRWAEQDFRPGKEQS